VLKDIEQALNILANLIGITSGGGRLAPPLTADKHKDGAGLIVPELIIHPVTLCIVSLITSREMIYLVREVQLLKSFYSHFLVLLGLTSE